jgi:hypothetical protein
MYRRPEKVHTVHFWDIEPEQLNTMRQAILWCDSEDASGSELHIINWHPMYSSCYLVQSISDRCMVTFSKLYISLTFSNAGKARSDEGTAKVDPKSLIWIFPCFRFDDERHWCTPIAQKSGHVSPEISGGSWNCGAKVEKLLHSINPNVDWERSIACFQWNFSIATILLVAL